MKTYITILMTLLLGIISPARSQQLATAAMLGTPAELHNQDTAFTLTIEALRTIQTSLIRADYQSRLNAADRERNPKTRDAITTLADMEQHLRERKLVKQIYQLQVAYGYARRHDEQQLGTTVPQVVDRHVVDRHLHELLPGLDLTPETPVFAAGPPVILDAFVSPPVTTPEAVEANVVSAAAQSFLDLLIRAQGPTNPVVGLLRATLLHKAGPPALAETDAAFALVSYRRRDEAIQDFVAQVFHPTASDPPVTRASGRSTTNPQKIQIFDMIDQWLTLFTQAAVQSYGDPVAITPRQRLFNRLLQADPTVIREESVEPLHIIGLLRRPQAYLPACLHSRVTGLVIEAEAGPAEWQCRIQLMMLNPDAALQAATILESWRMLAASLMASGELTTGQAYRQLVRSGSIEIVGNDVVFTSRAPSQLAMRGANRLMQWVITDTP